MTKQIRVPQKTVNKPHAFGREIKDSMREVRRFKDNQFSGTFTVGAGTSGFQYLFSSFGNPDQADTNYNVLATIESYSGTPNFSARVIDRIEKTTSYFTLWTVADPGAGNSVVWKFRLFRD